MASYLEEMNSTRNTEKGDGITGIWSEETTEQARQRAVKDF